MAQWRKRLFIATSYITADAAERFGLPRDRMSIMGSRIECRRSRSAVDGLAVFVDDEELGPAPGLSGHRPRARRMILLPALRITSTVSS